MAGVGFPPTYLELIVFCEEFYPELVSLLQCLYLPPLHLHCLARESAFLDFAFSLRSSPYYSRLSQNTSPVKEYSKSQTVIAEKNAILKKNVLVTHKIFTPLCRRFLRKSVVVGFLFGNFDLNFSSSVGLKDMET